MSKRKRYSPEFKREAIELVRRSGASCRQVAWRLALLRTCSHAGFERHNQVEKRPFLAREEACEMRNLLVSSVNWPE
ncbi:transposase [Pseudomonas aeruginosa]|nr:transposase [Pseudomonas aeruginosa]RTW22442.1 transposase [Pseudomonas aeruginosa]